MKMTPRLILKVRSERKESKAKYLARNYQLAVQQKDVRKCRCCDAIRRPWIEDLDVA
jgi:hypothetical protein